MALSYPSLSRGFSIKCCAVTVEDKHSIRLGLPSRGGRLVTDTVQMLRDCQILVDPQHQVSGIPQLSNLDFWFKRPKDIVQKLVSGDLDLGFVGLDAVCEYGQGNEDLILVHDALSYLDCPLSLAIPKDGIFENINSLRELAEMPHWTPERPLRVATGFTYLGPKFLKENGLKHVTFSVADGTIEAAPAMGIADAIIDLVYSGTPLRENNLKQIDGGVVLESQVTTKSLIKRKGVLDITHEMIERLEAHLRVIAKMRGSSQKDVTERILSRNSLYGLQGPTVSPVFCKRDGEVFADYYVIVICVPRKDLDKSILQLREIGASDLELSAVTYTPDEANTFNEESPRWRQLLKELGL